MKDLWELKRARYYMLAMSEGVNPCTGEDAGENDVIMQPQVQECCERIMMLLDKLIITKNMEKTETKRKRKKKKKRNFRETDSYIDIMDISLDTILNALLDVIEITDEPVGPNELARRINAVLGNSVKCITGYEINDFLVENGYLDITYICGRRRKKANELSGKIGVFGVKIEGSMREKIIYSRKAQEYVVENLGRILRYR